MIAVMKNKIYGIPGGKAVLTIQEFAMKLKTLVDMNTVFIE
jgi:hypothetical protein